MTSIQAHQYTGIPDQLAMALKIMGVDAELYWSFEPGDELPIPVMARTDTGKLMIDLGDWVALVAGELVVLDAENVRTEEVAVMEAPEAVQ